MRPYRLFLTADMPRKARANKRSRFLYPLTEKTSCALAHLPSKIAPSPVSVSLASKGASNKNK